MSVSSQSPHRPGSSIEFCEGPNDHHCRLSGRGYLPWRRRDLPEAPGLPADLTAGLGQLKLATMRERAPELRLTAKTQRWAPEEMPSTGGSTNPSHPSTVDHGDDLAGVEGATTLT